MELIKVGKNTKNAESIKIPGNIKTAFKKYLKAQQQYISRLKTPAQSQFLHLIITN